MTKPDFSKLRVGIVGAGLMGRWHANYARRTGAQLVSILDHDAAMAENLCGKTGGGAKTYTDISDMFNDSQLDVVHICTPLSSHFPVCTHAIDAGVHVLLEKPLARSVEETEALLGAAHNQSVRLCPVHQFGFQQGVRDAKQQLDSLGKLLSVRFTTASAGGEGRSAAELDEIIADIIPHPLSVLQRLLPTIKLDSGQWSGTHPRAGELLLSGEVDGIALDMYISMNARPTRCEMELLCSKGRITLNFFHGYAVIETGAVSRAQKILQPFKHALNESLVAGTNIGKRYLSSEPAYPGLSALITAFYRAVISGDDAPVAVADVLAIAVAREDIINRFMPDVAA